MKIVLPDPEGIQQASDALRAGEIVAYPTETVYGLGVDPHNPRALERLFDAKGRAERHPVLLIVDDIAQLKRVADSIPPRAAELMARFWPGPLSLLLPAVPGLSEMLLGPDGRICVRCPACDTARALCQAFGGPLTSTSANRSGDPPAHSVAELGLPGVALAIDGGILPPSLPSTVYDPETGEVLREGAISGEDLRGVE